VLSHKGDQKRGVSIIALSSMVSAVPRPASAPHRIGQNPARTKTTGEQATTANSATNIFL